MVAICSVCLCFPSWGNACDEFDRDYIIQRLLILQIKRDVVDNTERDFIMMANRCGFNISDTRVFDTANKTSKRKYSENTEVLKMTMNNLDILIKQTADKYGLDPALVKAIIHTESSFNSNAVSIKGAIGLTQVMPATASKMGVKPTDLWHPHINLDTGVRYLVIQLQRFDSLKKALIAYNAGPNVAERVKKPEDLKMIPNETKAYIKQVFLLYTMYKASGFGKYS